MQVETPTFSWVMNNPGMEGGKHYVTIFMLAAVTNPDKEPALMEPDKCEGEVGSYAVGGGGAS